MALKGSPQLRARLKALKTSFKGYGRAWADGTVQEARPRIPVRTGKLRRSVRVRNGSCTAITRTEVRTGLNQSRETALPLTGRHPLIRPRHA